MRSFIKAAIFLTLILIVSGFYISPAVAQNAVASGKSPAAGVSPLIFPPGDIETRFTWQGDSMNNTWEPLAALLIPVKLAGCPRTFYMQFDTGAPYTIFYSNPLKEIQEKYPQVIQLNDLSAKLETNLIIGGKTVQCKEATVIQSGDRVISWNNKQHLVIIGTLGADLIDNKVALIDYPRKKISLYTTMPAKLSAGVVLKDFMYVRNSILLPAAIRGKQTMLYFDTGSSAYELLTSKEMCMSLALPGAQAIQYTVNSWDKQLTANTLPTNDSIAIAAQNLPIHKVTYMEGVSDNQVQQMLRLGIGGLTGNKLFLQCALLLDVKNKKFGIMH